MYFKQEQLFCRQETVKFFEKIGIETNDKRKYLD